MTDRDPLPFRPAAAGSQPDNDAPSYRNTRRRHPLAPPVPFEHTLTEASGPGFSPAHYPPMADLSVVDGRQALGERIIVTGRVLDEAAARCATH